MGYRGLATRGMVAWVVVSVVGKMPIAMAPLGLVFLMRERPGGYALGATLAAGYVLSEVVGAAGQGMWLRQHRIRPQLALGFGVGAAAFAGLALAQQGPLALLLVFAFGAGAGPAASPGGTRSMLIAMVDEAEVPRALSTEGVLISVIWAVAPALTVLAATGISPVAPMVIAAGCAAAAAGLIFLVPTPGEVSTAPASAGSRWRTVVSGWPIYLTSAASMAMLAMAELVLPALLTHRGLPVGWAGPMLTAFAIASAIGAFCYGMRTWPGTVRAQALILLVVTAGCVALMAVLPGVGIAIALTAAGLSQAGVMVTRSLAVREQLPADLHASAYSAMYAVGGVGYGLAAATSAVILTHASPSTAILSGVGITLVLTAVSWLAERMPSRQMPEVDPVAELCTQSTSRITD